MSSQPPAGPDFTAPPPAGPPGWPPPPPPAAAPPPGDRTPRHRRWVAAVAVAAVVAVVATAVLVVPGLVRTVPSAGSTAGPGELVTVTPSAVPTNSVVLTSGGGIAAPVAVTTAQGKGTFEITSARWTSSGRMEPPQGLTYLVVEVKITATQGVLDISSLSLIAYSDLTSGTGNPDARSQSAFGPELENQLPGVRLSAGHEASGQVGFVLHSGPTLVALVDANLNTIGTTVVPAP